MIGCFPDTLGIITQAQALADFAGGELCLPVDIHANMCIHIPKHALCIL
jgi:hypothetical protein